MKKNSKFNKIALNTETVRILSTSLLSGVAGGLANSFDICGTSQTGSCVSVGCSSGVPCTNSTVGC